jgi:hypothetical protein
MVVARVVVWVVLYATALRYAGGAIAVWAGGTFTVVTTILVGVVAPVWLFVVAPTWFAWRVAAPLGLRRLALAACWLSPLVRARDLAGIRVFLDVAAGRPMPPLAGVRADAWTALALALAAEHRHDAATAGRIVDALLHLPAGSRFPRLARARGAAALVAAARARRDDGAAAGYAELAPGHLVRGTTGTRTDAPLPIAPPPSPPGPVERAIANADPRLQHLRLLSAAASGQAIDRRRVFTLAAAWEGIFDAAAMATLRARALELGVPHGEARARSLRDVVLDELGELAAPAEGSPGAGLTSFPDGGLVSDLAGRLRDRVCRGAEAALARFGRRPGDAPAPPLETWQRWLALRTALDDVEQAAGLPALSSLWYGGVRDAVWATACALHADPGHGGPWLAVPMFTWIADRAEMLGDLPATLLNRENARSAAAAA